MGVSDETLGVSLSVTASSADLGGSSKYIQMRTLKTEVEKGSM